MKHFKKGQEPEKFRDWKAQTNENWRPRFEDLRGDEKKAVLKSLFKEQGYICCYCESRLTMGNCHIEHLQPQSDPDIDPLDYSNFLCSCQNNLKKGEPRHCGNSKGDHILPISPLDPACESRFSFNNKGEIIPAKDDDIEALDTIDNILKLNSSDIVDTRQEIIAFFDEEIDQKSEEKISVFIRDSLDKDQDGKYEEHWTLIKDLYGSFII
ncbi:MAG: TIGR02646 family protein [Symploca sp. SIO2G7]|nr:TIGR02646 family protein [Symploca sp. SIO2G7]